MQRWPTLQPITCLPSIRHGCSSCRRTSCSPRTRGSQAAPQHPLNASPRLQEVFLTPHHLAIAMEYAPGGDLSLLVDQCRARGVRRE